MARHTFRKDGDYIFGCGADGITWVLLSRKCCNVSTKGTLIHVSIRAMRPNRPTDGIAVIRPYLHVEDL